MRRAFAVLFLGLAVGLGVTACGGKSKSTSTSTTTTTVSSKSAYERQMQALGQQIDSVMLAVSNANNSQTASGQPLPAKTEAANLEVAQRELKSAAAKLAKIVPPAPVEAPHALLLKGLREVTTALTPLIAKIKKGGNTLALFRSILKFKGLHDMQVASAQIAKAGYDILGTGSTGG